MEGVAVPDYPLPGIRERALDLLLPPLCVGCRRIGRWICPQCWPRIGWHHTHKCEVCANPSATPFCFACGSAPSSLRAIVAPVTFDSLGREAVHTLKYDGRHAISTLMGRLMARAAVDLPIDVVTHVPLHPSRRRERGYDQAALLAGACARALDRPAMRDSLRRTRRTRQQAKLDDIARRANVAGAFKSKRAVAGLGVLLVDDVFTTGATMEAAAEALRDGGAIAVYGCAFAYVDRGASADTGMPTP